MARIFISYSRVDGAFVEKLYVRLQRLRPGDVVWYDQAPDGLLGGDSWWEAILDAIAAADVFIYVLSNESVQSKYCQAEFAEARRLRKRVITIQARDRTKLTGALRDIHYVDMKDGVDDPEALASLGGALDRQLRLVRRRRPAWQPRTPKPAEDTLPARPADAPDIDTPTLQLPASERRAPDKKRRNILTEPWAIIIAAVLTGIFVIIAALITTGGGGEDGDDAAPATPPQTEAAGAVLETPAPAPPTATDAPSDTPEPTRTSTDSPSDTPRPSDTPEPTLTPSQTLEIAAIVATLDVQATAEQATLDAEATVAARATEYAVGTQEVQDQTATATRWTDTPTPNITASIDAYRTQQAGTVTQAWIDSWTPTPSPTPTATPHPLQAALDRAQTFSGSNDDWQPFIWEFDGVEMALVPPGCFQMGSEDGDGDEQPVHTVCFEEPFWIDRYEVTNAQYGSTGCEDYSSAPEQPRNCVSWTEAQAFCEAREARLPTEAEWEYAARGPDGLVYPWGDTFVADYVIYGGSPEYGETKTAPVGSRPAGASWVGAEDLSGNVWEWVADWYDADYYGTLAEGVVNPTGPETGSYRVFRGGSFFNGSEYLRGATVPSRRYNPYYWNNRLGVRCVRVRVPHLD